MAITYRKASDNVGFEVIDTRTEERLYSELIFSRQEAIEIVRGLKIKQRGAPKKFRNKKKKPKRKVVHLRR